ncbi:MAG: phosphatase PAP2 family protein [Spirochaetales bacterium]
MTYLLLAGMILASHWGEASEYAPHALLNLAAAVVIWYTALHPPRSRVLRLAWALYPLVLIGIAFVQVGPLARIVYGPSFTFDPLVAEWDAIVFGLNPHAWLHEALPGRVWAELMHLLYVLYFPLIIGAFLFVAERRPHDYPRFAFVFLASFLTFVVVFVLFPATGPLDYREGLFGSEVIFSSLVDFLFTFGVPDPGGAFPSSHVGQSVVVLLLLRPVSRSMAAVIVFVILGIGVSMGYASVHYSVDALAGLPSGAVLYFVWNRVYRRMAQRTAA